MDALAQALLAHHPERATLPSTQRAPEPPVPPEEPTKPAPIIFLPVKPVVDQARAIMNSCGTLEPRMGVILDEVCKFYGETRIALISHRKCEPLVTRRQIAMFLCREMTTQSLPQIGRHFCDRDHTTILHGTRKIDRLVAEGGRIADEVAVLKLRILDLIAEAA